MINIIGSLLEDWRESGVDDLSEPLLVTSCGYQKFLTKDYVISRPNGRSDFLIIYLIKGKGYYTFDNKKIEVKENNIIIYPPFTEQYYTYLGEDNTELYWIHITGNSVGEYLKKLQLSGKIHYVGSDNVFNELFEKIIHELQLKNPMFQQFITGYFIQLISQFARKMLQLQTNSTVLMKEDIKKAIELMYKFYNKNYSAEEYAGYCNLSVYRFIHKFKQATGMTPIDYITKIRINAAKELLANSTYNVCEIASIVGYENPLYFSRVFKKFTGVPPSKYRCYTG
jgi:AraC family transcriptional regulator of arabinose operon